jgi:glutathione S-transferase/autophagy-related protein 2
MWLLLYKETPFDMVLINPGTSGENGSRHPDFLAKNPAGTIPTIEEPDTGFALGEAHAIMCYLSSVNGWTDVYPDELQRRAKVDEYLHFHHRNVREASVGLVAPKIRKDLNIPESTQQMARATLTRALQALESGWLADSAYIAGDTVSIADFAAYVEIGQLQPEFTNVYQFTEFPRVSAWMERLKALPGHDDVHVVLRELGDISVEPPSMDTIKNANKSALKALKIRLAQLSA